MWSLNFKKLVPLLGVSLLCINNVKAEIPVCTSCTGTGTSKSCTLTNSSYDYCQDSSDKLLYPVGVQSNFNDGKLKSKNSGLYFIKTGNFEIFPNTVQNPTQAHLIDLTVDSAKSSYSFTEKTITEGFYIQGGDLLVYCDNNGKCQSEAINGSNKFYYIDNNKGLIKSDSGSLSNENKVDNGYYVNGNTKNNASKQLIKCNPTCTEVAAQDGDAYIDVTEEGVVITCT